MRNGDFSAVTQRIYDPLTGDVNGNNRAPFANNQIPPDRISPIAQQAARVRAAAEHRRRAARPGQLPAGADAREDDRRLRRQGQLQRSSEKDQMSYRVSFMRPVVFDPGLFGEYGGPANDGFAGTGTNKSYQHGGDVDAGRSASRRCSTSAAASTTTTTSRSTTGRRPDHEQRRRHPGREPRRVHQRPVLQSNVGGYGESAARVLGQPAVGPLREDVERRGYADQVEEQAHAEVRRRVAEEHRHAAADAGRRRTARPVQLQRQRHRDRPPRRHR